MQPASATNFQKIKICSTQASLDHLRINPLEKIANIIKHNKGNTGRFKKARYSSISESKGTAEGACNMARNIPYFYLLFIAITWPLTAMSDCSDAHVKALSNQGKTVSEISKRCDLSKEEVLSVLQDDSGNGEPQPQPTNSLIPSGNPVSQCGCWGPAMPGARISDQRCQAGVAIAVACNMYCPTGGLAWMTICQ